MSQATATRDRGATVFAAELATWGPGAADRRVPGIEESRAYCRRLARTHYENFTVASWLLPRRLRPHFHAIYAYCRWADDLADETAGPRESLDLLEWWRSQLVDCYAGRATHPVFVALRETICQFDIPQEPLLDLLSAFEQDQQVTRYATVDELLDYCRRSANPVGRLVLHLGGCHDAERAELADSVCTGLQWANFCQDVAGDLARGRIYLPRQTWQRHGYGEAMFAAAECNGAFRAAMAEEVDRAEAFLRAGLPLVETVPRWLRVDVSLFIHGGLAILDRIRRVDYDVWRRRPALSRWDHIRLLAHCWWTARFGSARTRATNHSQGAASARPSATARSPTP